MNERTRHVIVGLTAIGALISLAVLLILFGAVPRWLEGGYPIQVEMSKAAGLTAGSRVRLDGIDIGRVDKIELADKHVGVNITIMIRDQYRIPQGSNAKVESGLFGSSPALDFNTNSLKPGDEVILLKTDGSETVRAVATSFTSELEKKMQEALEKPAVELTRLVDHFESLSSTWTEVGKHIADLTAPRDLADVDNKTARANITTVLVRADARLAELKKAIGGINAIINDGKLREDVKATIANARSASEEFKIITTNLKDAASSAKAFTGRLDSSADKVDKLIESANRNVNQLSRRYVAVADDLSKAIASAKQMMDKASTGKGTIGKLLNDPALYNNLNDSVKRLDAALVELRLLIKKWEKEGLLKL